MKIWAMIVGLFAYFLMSSAALSATLMWKKIGPINLDKPGHINVFVVEDDATEIEVTLLDKNQNFLEKKGTREGFFTDEPDQINFENLSAGVYYVLVETNGTEDFDVYAMGRYSSSAPNEVVTSRPCPHED